MGEFLNSMEWYYINLEQDITPCLHFQSRTKKDFERWHQELKAKLLEFDIFMGEHSFAGNKAFSFFDKHLKGQMWNSTISSSSRM